MHHLCDGRCFSVIIAVRAIDNVRSCAVVIGMSRGVMSVFFRIKKEAEEESRCRAEQGGVDQVKLFARGRAHEGERRGF